MGFPVINSSYHGAIYSDTSKVDLLRFWNDRRDDKNSITTRASNLNGGFHTQSGRWKSSSPLLAATQRAKGRIIKQTTIGTQKGANTHVHDHSITFPSFRPINSKRRALLKKPQEFIGHLLFLRNNTRGRRTQRQRHTRKGKDQR